MQTTFVKSSDIKPTWYQISADNQVLGSLAVRIAKVLMGKHKASYTPHEDDGDYVVVTDAEKIAVTGRKEKEKLYRFHSGYVGGLKEVPLARMRQDRPEQILRLAVKRMLPKNRLGRRMLDKLKIYAWFGPQARRPEAPAAALSPANGPDHAEPVLHGARSLRLSG